MTLEGTDLVEDISSQVSVLRGFSIGDSS